MDNDKMIRICKAAVVDYFNKNVDKTENFHIAMDDCYIVWFCKTLQNFKALVSTTVPDGMYYELTYSGDKDELYLDVYKRFKNVCLKLTDVPGSFETSK